MTSSHLTPGSAKKTAELASNGVPDAERKQSEQAMAKMQEFLKEYSPNHFKGEKDVLQDRYQIHLSRAMPQFDTEFSRAFEATDLTAPNARLLAKICDTGKVQRFRVLNHMASIDHPAVMRLAAHDSVVLSAGNVERLVIVYEQPGGTRLTELVKQRKLTHNPHYLLEHILIPLITGLEHFAQEDISHGLLNPDNIYFNERNAVLGPCDSEPCGYAQPFLYESLERMQANPCGKGEGSILQDYYALSVTLLYILHGPDHFKGFTPESLMFQILKDGAYNTLMRERDVPEIFYDLLRGTLTQSPEERWSTQQLKTWLGGKRYNVLPPPTPADAVRHFEFKDIPINNRRELAHLFASDWPAMMIAIQGSSLSHWVTISLRNKELADQISRMCRSALETNGKNEALAAEMLMNIVLLLDQLGPLRIRELRMHAEAISTMFAEMYAKKVTVELQFLTKLIETNMVNIWLNMQVKRKPDFDVSESFHDLIQRLDKIRPHIRNSGFGFGMERLLYDLNPDMPCQSSIFDNMYVKTLPQLLRHLDKIAATLTGDELVDRHIAAFIASKLQIQNEIRLNSISSISSLANSRHMVALHLIAMAQNRVEPMRLPGLTHWFGVRLLPLMDSIHSKTLRQKMKTVIATLAPQGLTQKMSDLMIHADYADADCNGFERAVSTYHKNVAEILSLKEPERLERDTHKMGLNIATLLAYAGLMFSVFYIIRGFSS